MSTTSRSKPRGSTALLAALAIVALVTLLAFFAVRRADYYRVGAERQLNRAGLLSVTRSAVGVVTQYFELRGVTVDCAASPPAVVAAAAGTPEAANFPALAGVNGAAPVFDATKKTFRLSACDPGRVDAKAVFKAGAPFPFLAGAATSCPSVVTVVTVDKIDCSITPPAVEVSAVTSAPRRVAGAGPEIQVGSRLSARIGSSSPPPVVGPPPVVPVVVPPPVAGVCPLIDPARPLRVRPGLKMDMAPAPAGGAFYRPVIDMDRVIQIGNQYILNDLHFDVSFWVRGPPIYVDPRSKHWRHLKYHVIVTGALTDENCSYDSKLLVNYYNNGCFPSGTRVLGSDGSQRRIETILPGDTIWNPLLHQAMKVALVHRSAMDQPIVAIDSVAGRLRATERHPVLTSEGPVPARELERGQQIRSASGALVEVRSIRRQGTAKRDSLYNLELEGTGEKAHYFVAEGTVVGDFLLQERKHFLAGGQR